MSDPTPRKGIRFYHSRVFLAGRPLTALELAAVDLAGDGFSDAEIGARLQCSENSAGQALHRAAWKLETRGRAGAVAQGYLRGWLKAPTQPSPPAVRLPPRQFQVVRLTAAGLTDEQIAERLGISLDSVRRHAKRMRERLGARDRAHAVRRSVETGALPLVRKASTAPDEVSAQ